VGPAPRDKPQACHEVGLLTPLAAASSPRPEPWYHAAPMPTLTMIPIAAHIGKAAAVSSAPIQNLLPRKA
jgi:hypothetical protein